MNGLLRVLTGMVLAASLGAGGALQAQSLEDYPTAFRVEYVLECMRERDNPAYELIHKCSCVFDRLAGATPYDRFLENWITAKGVFIAGERGATLRDNREAQKVARAFRAEVEKAEIACFLRPPDEAGG